MITTISAGRSDDHDDDNVLMMSVDSEVERETLKAVRGINCLFASSRRSSQITPLRLN